MTSDEGFNLRWVKSMSEGDPMKGGFIGDTPPSFARRKSTLKFDAPDMHPTLKKILTVNPKSMNSIDELKGYESALVDDVIRLQKDKDQFLVVKQQMEKEIAQLRLAKQSAEDEATALRKKHDVGNHMKLVEAEQKRPKKQHEEQLKEMGDKYSDDLSKELAKHDKEKKLTAQQLQSAKTQTVHKMSQQNFNHCVVSWLMQKRKFNVYQMKKIQ